MLHPQLVRRLFAVTHAYTEEPERDVKPTRHSRITQGTTGLSSALTHLGQALVRQQILFNYFSAEKKKKGKSLAHSQGNSRNVAFGVWAVASVPEKPRCIRIATQGDRPVPLAAQGLQMHNFTSPTAHGYGLSNLDHNTQYVVNPVVSVS